MKVQCPLNIFKIKYKKYKKKNIFHKYYRDNVIIFKKKSSKLTYYKIINKSFIGICTHTGKTVICLLINYIYL